MVYESGLENHEIIQEMTADWDGSQMEEYCQMETCKVCQ